VNATETRRSAHHLPFSFCRIEEGGLISDAFDFWLHVMVLVFVVPSSSLLDSTLVLAVSVFRF
jgi:hypothetical protein